MNFKAFLFLLVSFFPSLISSYFTSNTIIKYSIISTTLYLNTLIESKETVEKTTISSETNEKGTISTSETKGKETITSSGTKGKGKSSTGGAKDTLTGKYINKAYNIIFRRDVVIDVMHKFVSEIKKRSNSKDFPNFNVKVDKVLTSMKLIRIVSPTDEAFEFITNHKFVKEFYETQITNDDL